jgi:hypothetical protein
MMKEGFGSGCLTKKMMILVDAAITGCGLRVVVT